jgi:NADPH:quinone reductase-like Zn-dependent oxidoreductase
MRSVLLREFGTDGLVIEEGDVPRPGPGEVLVQVRAASVNYRDFMICQGYYNPQLELPLVPLSDGAGEVIEVGPDVSDVQTGDRVTSLFWQNWISGTPAPGIRTISTGCEAPGMLAEYAVLPAGAVAPMPAGFDYAESATLPCAALTAWSCLHAGGQPAPGDTVLLLGTGGVSLFGLAFAKSFGAEVVITSSSDTKLERARALGADHAINYSETPEWGQKVVELTGGADCVVETGGAGTLPQSMSALALGGSIALVGALAGVSAELNLLGLVGKNGHLHGITVGHRQAHKEMCRHIEANEIRPVIDKRYAIDQSGEAIPGIAAGAHFGKLVIEMDE